MVTKAGLTVYINICTDINRQLCSLRYLPFVNTKRLIGRGLLLTYKEDTELSLPSG